MATISVVVPTYNRPEMLGEVLDSLAKQSRRPDEVIVGDDSPDAVGQAVAERVAQDSGLNIRYIHNSPSLKQARNVSSLIEQASCELLCLIHDDDWLLPNALEDLHTCFESHPEIAAAYGTQQVASHEGAIDQAASDELNQAYGRVASKEGAQPNTMVAAITQQFPNNGWLVHTHLAKAANYAGGEENFHDAIDFAFGIKLAQQAQGGFYFLNKPMAVYRLSNVSVLRNSNETTAYYAHRYVAENCADYLDNAEVLRWLSNRSMGAIVQALALGHKKQAWRIFWSKAHRSRILTPGGIRRFLKILTAR